MEERVERGEHLGAWVVAQEQGEMLAVDQDFAVRYLDAVLVICSRGSAMSDISDICPQSMAACPTTSSTVTTNGDRSPSTARMQRPPWANAATTVSVKRGAGRVTVT